MRRGVNGVNGVSVRPVESYRRRWAGSFFVVVVAIFDRIESETVNYWLSIG